MTNPARAVRRAIGRGLNSVLHRFGYLLTPTPDAAPVPPDMDPAFLPVYQQTRPFTMTGVEAMYALYKSVAYVSEHKIGGAIVECGVWKGGSMMLAALALGAAGDTGRELYLYDTFAGMAEPSERDRDVGSGKPVHDKWRRLQKGAVNEWCYSPLEEVERNMASTGYPAGQMRFVRGKVEETIPATMPERIALLRLDTDWYDSTYHELTHLFPRLATGGVLIVDDYGQWTGAREATDQYFRERGTRILLDRIPRGGCIAVKQE